MRSLLGDMLPNIALKCAPVLVLALSGCVDEIRSATVDRRSDLPELMLLESTRPSSDDLLAIVDTEPDRDPAGNARDDTTMPGARGLKRFGVMPHLGDLEAMVERSGC